MNKAQRRHVTRRIVTHNATHGNNRRRRRIRNLTVELAVANSQITRRGHHSASFTIHGDYAKNTAHRRTARNLGRHDFALVFVLGVHLQFFLSSANGLEIAGNATQSRPKSLCAVMNIDLDRILQEGCIFGMFATDCHARDTAQEHLVVKFLIKHLRNNLGACITGGYSSRVRDVDVVIARDVRNSRVFQVAHNATGQGGLNRIVGEENRIDRHRVHGPHKGSHRIIVGTVFTFARNIDADTIQLDILHGHI